MIIGEGDGRPEAGRPVGVLLVEGEKMVPLVRDDVVLSWSWRTWRK